MAAVRIKCETNMLEAFPSWDYDSKTPGLVMSVWTTQWNMKHMNLK